MISKLCSLLSVGHSRCKSSLNDLKQLLLARDANVRSLNSQILGFVNQIQELKAVHNYATKELEKKITELQDKLDLHHTVETPE